jgi:Peptidase family M23
MPQTSPGGVTNLPTPTTNTATIATVFDAKGLWKWWEQNNGIGTNPFNGVTEKGIDYSNAWGTPIGVPVGGKILRIVHNTNSIGDVVELQAYDGSVWLYQHIDTKVKVGQTLGVGGIIGTEDGLPIDQYSTGPHIEVRYCRPGMWNPAIDSWNEAWVNPYTIFSNLSNQPSGSVDSGSILNLTSAQAVIGKLSPDANVTQTLYALDQFGALTNPFHSSAITPWGWMGDVGTTLFGDMQAIVFRFVLLVIGAFLIYKAISQFVDVGAVVGAAARLGESAALMV